MRCAIYTRKSSEAGLEQDFNSLDAQREACEAYIASQKHEGWTALSTFYNDGGVSGGTLERPALERLLGDIEEDLIDTIVVYKVDRLSRALSDFAKLVEIFDRHEISFVSVTQQFNTTSSMGRLTLNVLLSFAQFEREVTGERIRDKIAAAKKKGLWMGGNPPLGYDVKNKELVVNEAEAETVRYIFRQYREIESVRELRSRIAAEGVTSKRRIMRDGSIAGDKPINRGALYYLLQNRLYLGEIVHKEKSYPGNHEAIVDEALWDEVQDILAANTNGERRKEARQPSLLTGLVVDEQGESLTPSHAVKKGRRYRYYVSHHLITEGKRAERKGWRIPAADLEGLVVTRLKGWLGDAAAVSEIIENDPLDPSAHAALITSAKAIAKRWPELKPHRAKAYLNALLQRVIVESGRIVIEIDCERAMATLLAVPEALSAKRSRHECPSDAEHLIILEVPAVLKRAGLGMTLIVPGARQDATPDPSLIRLLLRAFAIRDRLERNPDLPLKRIAEAEGVSPSYATRALASCLPRSGHRHGNPRRSATARADREHAHEEHPPAVQVESSAEAARVRTRLISRSIASRPVLSLGAGCRELRQPFRTSKRRTTEKGLRDDRMETVRHTALMRLCQWRSITRVPVNTPKINDKSGDGIENNAVISTR